jgi:hypothetical protein
MATLETRRHKDHTVSGPRLFDDWRERAAEHGFDRAAAAQVLDRAHAMTDAVSLLGAPEGLTRDRSTFSRREVLQAFAESTTSGATVAELETQAEAFLASLEVVALAPVTGEARFSTRELLEIEQALITVATDRKCCSAAVVPDSTFAMAVAARPTLSPEQAALVESLATSGDGVQVVRAAAGTGKTFALDAARARRAERPDLPRVRFRVARRPPARPLAQSDPRLHLAALQPPVAVLRAPPPGPDHRRRSRPLPRVQGP